MKKIILYAAIWIIYSSDFAVTAQEKIEVPAEVKEISEQLGEQYCICPELIQAICWRESRFASDVENNGCIGVMQVASKWHKDRMKKLGVTDLTDIRQNMTVAVDYLSELIGEYEDIGIVLMKYNGDSKFEKLLSDNEGEISGYVGEILKISAELEQEHGK